MSKFYLILLCVLLQNYNCFGADSLLEEDSDTARYVVEGRVFPPDPPFTPPNWQANTYLQLNGGEYLGYIKEDGSFIIHNVPSGSYILDVVHPDFMYEPVRVEINSKGKLRARKVNHIQTSQVIQVAYPLKLKPLGRYRYFQVREQLRVTDFLMNPMILMMVLPLLIIMILPKMMSDPETKKEMEQLNTLTKYELPELSEVVASFITGQQLPKKNNKQKKRQ